MDWTKSSYSAPNGDCVEIATPNDGEAYLRNSNHPDRGTLAVPATALVAFVAACQTGDFDDLTA